MTMGMGTWATRAIATALVAADGTGDFTDIQAAINSLPAGGGVVYIKEGTYTITQGIVIDRDNVAIIGAGASTRIETNEDPIDMIIAIGRDGILIKNLYFYGNQIGANCSGLSLGPITNSVISECWFERFSRDNLFVFQGNNVIVRNCIIFDNTAVIGNGIGFTECTNSFCNGNIVYDCDDLNILMDECSDVEIGGNSSYQSGSSGMNVEDSFRCRIINNHSYENVRFGIILLDSDDCAIIGNICKDNDVNDTASFDGITLSDSDDNIISGNRCEDNDRYEINILNNTCNNTIILGNNCNGADHVGTINDAGTNTMIAHNEP